MMTATAAETRAGSGKNPGPGLEAAREATAPTLRPRVRRSGADGHLGLGKFKSDEDREEEGKKMPSGEKQQEGSRPHLWQCELLLRAPLTSGLGVSSGWGRGTMPDYGAAGAPRGERGGRWDGKKRWTCHPKEYY